MALRRPPTRIELKSDDIEEYEEMKNERLMAASDAKGSEMNVAPMRYTPAKEAKKNAAMDRIGVNRHRR